MMIKLEKGIKEENVVESEENVKFVPFCATVSTKMFLIYFSLITFMMIIIAFVMFLPKSSPLDIFADADTDIESDSGSVSNLVIDRLFIPLRRANSDAIHSVNSDGSDYKFIDFGAYKRINHVHTVKSKKEVLIVSYTKGSDYNRSYFYFWEKDTITEPIVAVDSTQMVTNDESNLVAYVSTDENGKSSIVICDEKIELVKRIESNSSNYYLPRFGGPDKLLFYLENDINSNDKFIINSINLNDMKTATITELKNRPEEMSVSAHLEILIKIRNNEGKSELITIDSKTGKSKSLLQTKKEIIYVDWSSDGYTCFFSKRTGFSGYNLYKTINEADGKISFKSIKDEKGQKIKF